MPAEAVIKVRENGPLLVTGPVKVIDYQGNVFVAGDAVNIVLCRCGRSQKKPFCDGAHKTCGFAAAELAPNPAESSPAGSGITPPAT